MADNLSVQVDRPSAQASNASAPAEKQQDSAADEVARLKDLAKSRHNKNLSDDVVRGILARRKEKLAHESTIDKSRQSFEASQGKEALVSKGAERATQAQKAMGTQEVRGADGLSTEDRQSVRSDPKAGPKLPPTDAKAPTPEQAQKLLGAMLGLIEVDGQPVDLEAYAASLKQAPASKGKSETTSKGATAQPGGKPSLGRSAAGLSAQGRTGAASGKPMPMGSEKSGSVSARLPMPSAAGKTSASRLSFNPRATVGVADTKVSADGLLNAGGSIVSGWSFDNANINLDAFFAMFIMRSVKDMQYWRKMMRELQSLSRQFEMAGQRLQMTRELLQQRRERFDALSGFGKTLWGLRDQGHQAALNSVFATDKRFEDDAHAGTGVLTTTEWNDKALQDRRKLLGEGHESEGKVKKAITGFLGMSGVNVQEKDILGNQRNLALLMREGNQQFSQARVYKLATDGGRDDIPAARKAWMNERAALLAKVKAGTADAKDKERLEAVTKDLRQAARDDVVASRKGLADERAGLQAKVKAGTADDNDKNRLAQVEKSLREYDAALDIMDAVDKGEIPFEKVEATYASLITTGGVAFGSVICRNDDQGNRIPLDDTLANMGFNQFQAADMKARPVGPKGETFEHQYNELSVAMKQRSDGFIEGPNGEKTPLTPAKQRELDEKIFKLSSQLHAGLMRPPSPIADGQLKLEDEKHAALISAAADATDQVLFGRDSLLMQSVDNAIANATDDAKRHEAEVNGQIRSGVGQAQGMINQLMQVLAMSRSR